jgi:hypothetical protein
MEQRVGVEVLFIGLAMEVWNIFPGVASLVKKIKNQRHWPGFYAAL